MSLTRLAALTPSTAPRQSAGVSAVPSAKAAGANRGPCSLRGVRRQGHLENSQSASSITGDHGAVAWSRRQAVGAALLAMQGAASVPDAQASVVGPAGDRVWEAFGGGPADLFFTDDFLGLWSVRSTLVKLETPLGEEFVPDMRVVQRAKQADLDQPVSYACSFVRNIDGKVVMDRQFNTVSLLKMYMGDSVDYNERIVWDINNPNDMRISLPGGTIIETRITRRSANTDAAESRIETSEFFRQIFDTSQSTEDKVKASQCFTKYKWRTREASGDGPVIVATQVVSDYLTPYDGEQKMLEAMNRPVVQYTYKMSFVPIA